MAACHAAIHQWRYRFQGCAQQGFTEGRPGRQGLRSATALIGPDSGSGDHRQDESVHNGPKTATRFRQQLPEARIELVDDANHMILNDQPEIVEKLLVDFLH